MTMGKIDSKTAPNTPGGINVRLRYERVVLDVLITEL